MKLIEMQKKLLQSGLKIFSTLEFKRLMGVSRSSAQQLLERYTKSGVLARLKGGLYAIITNYPSNYLIANKLYEPSYISFEKALSYYNLIPEAVYSITSATTRTTREFTAGQQHFIYHKLKKPAFTGYALTAISGENALFAEKEKALADYLYLIFLGKKKLNERLKTRGINTAKLISFASLFGRPKYLEWIRCFLKNK